MKQDDRAGERSERAYWTREVAERLEIGQSTIRKYCLALEEKGYEFTKGQRGVRAFLDRDIAVLECMRDILNETGTTIEEAVSVALNERESDVAHVVPSFEDKEPEQKNDIAQVVLTPQLARNLLDMFREELLGQVREEVMESLKEQELRAIERENEREKRAEERYGVAQERENKRDEQLMSLVRDMQETKKLIAATQQKRWWQFWK